MRPENVHVLAKVTDLESGINGIWGCSLLAAHTSLPTLFFPCSTSLLHFQLMLHMGPNRKLKGFPLAFEVYTNKLKLHYFLPLLFFP